MMQRRLFVLGASALVLAGCGGNLIGPPDPGPIYVLRPPLAPAPAGGAKVSWSLAILRPDVPGGLDSDRIALVQPDGTMDFYAKASYPDRLPIAIQTSVLDGFETSGRIDAVAREEQALHADYNLLIEVKDFSAHYAAPDGVPAVAVVLSAKLATTQSVDEADDERPRSWRSSCGAIRCHEARLAMQLIRMLATRRTECAAAKAALNCG